MQQVIPRFLGLVYAYGALPALAVIGTTYFVRFRSRSGACFAVGAVATAVGAIINHVVPIESLIDQTTGTLSSTGTWVTSSAAVLHLCGFIVLVIGLGGIALAKQDNRV